MPALPVSLLEPIWAQFAALLPDHPEVNPTHPLECHRRRIPDRTVFEHVVAALVHGSGYERIASPGCSDRTIRRRVHAWAAAGLTEHLHGLVLAQYDRLIGLDLRHVCVDGCITKAPGGGSCAGRSPVDRGKQGRKRSLLTDAAGIPLHLVAAGANRPDSALLQETLAGLRKVGSVPPAIPVHLDRGYAGALVQIVLAELGCTGVMPPGGPPIPGTSANAGSWNARTAGSMPLAGCDGAPSERQWWTSISSCRQVLSSPHSSSDLPTTIFAGPLDPPPVTRRLR